MLDINQARRGNGSTELGGLTLIKTKFIVVIGLALVERALKAGVTAHKERHVLGSLVGHLVRHGHLCRIDRVACNDLKRIRILLEQLGVVGRAQAQRNHAVALLLELPLLLAGKAVAGKLDLAAAHGHRATVTKAAANRKANGCLARPDRRIALPQVLATVGFNRSERSASRAQCHANRTVIKNKLHRSLPFRTPARRVSGADRKPARAPSQKREPSTD